MSKVISVGSSIQNQIIQALLQTHLWDYFQNHGLLRKIVIL